jgi:hypothetical protein
MATTISKMFQRVWCTHDMMYDVCLARGTCVRYPPRFGKIGDLGGTCTVIVNFQNEGNIFYC